MPWLSLSLEVDEAHAEAVSDALLDAGALSVSMEDADAGAAHEQPIFGEPGVVPGIAWRRNRVHALAAEDADADALVATACAAAGVAVPRYAIETVEEQDWVRATQAQFDPVRAGKRLWVVPSWHEPPDDPQAIVVRLDPGLAFGTGSHPTTRLVLEWLEYARCAGRRVLDYGCGSGILAIAAARLGATHVDGVDLDPQALAAALANAEGNAVALRTWLPDRLPAGQYDMVLATILANPLIVLAPLLAARCEEGGSLALSGILASQADEVIAAYRAHFDLAVVGTEDGWSLIAGRRR